MSIVNPLHRCDIYWRLAIIIHIHIHLYRELTLQPIHLGVVFYLFSDEERQEEYRSTRRLRHDLFEMVKIFAGFCNVKYTNILLYLIRLYVIKNTNFRNHTLLEVTSIIFFITLRPICGLWNSHRITITNVQLWIHSRKQYMLILE